MFCLCVHLWLMQLRLIHLDFLHTHSYRHAECILHVFELLIVRLILLLRAAGQHQISSYLSCAHIDFFFFWSRLNYFGMRPITQVLHAALFDRASFPQSLSHTQLTFRCLHSSFAGTYKYMWVFVIYFWHVCLTLEFSWLCVCVCFCVRMRCSKNKREWVPIMNNAWCGFLVSETDRLWGLWTAPWALYCPPQTVVKQTRSAEARPTSTLLLL